jgi:hypothetical protein
MLFQDIKGVFVVEINCGLWEDRQQEEDQLISCLRLYIWGDSWSAKFRVLDLRTIIQVACGAYFKFLTTIIGTVLKNHLCAESMADVSHLNLPHALVLSPLFHLIFVILTRVNRECFFIGTCKVLALCYYRNCRIRFVRVD